MARAPGGPSPASNLGAYYDRLARWTRWARLFGYGGGATQLTVHRRLADPRAGGRATTGRIHDIIAELLPPLKAPRILDAGCGFGGTMLDLVSRFDGTAVGLTLSHTQQQRALHAVHKRGFAERIDVRVQSFDTPPEGPFDVIVAIEALAHSHAPAVTLNALARVLAPGGALVIVDDMPESASAGTKDLDLFRRGWKAPVAWGDADYVPALRRLGLVVREHDLTEQLRVRSLAQTQWLEWVNRATRAVVPSQGVREVLDSYRGGLALERLYRRGAMSYRLLVAERPAE